MKQTDEEGVNGIVDKQIKEREHRRKKKEWKSIRESAKTRTRIKLSINIGKIIYAKGQRVVRTDNSLTFLNINYK